MSAFRKLAAAALISVTVPFSALAPALAQDAGDPPDSVARIAEIAGTVSFHAVGSQDWQAASANYPVTAGSGVWAEERSHASVDVNGARVHLDGASDLEITAIDPQAVQLSVPQGAIFVHVYPGAAGQTYEIDTPRGAARIAQPGQYEVEAGDDQHPMTLSVYEGAAQLVGQSANMTVQPGQRGLINPDNSSSTAAAQPDDFVRMVQGEEQAYANTAQTAQTAQYVSPSEPGYQDLARYGQWQTAPQYGAVWYPQQVAADWAPYRDGHWAYVAPWGWTWVDDAPWGFTPFHYGRWVQVGGRWGWTPGERVERPVYAPALVSFFGNIGGVGIDLSVGWVPLAPEEVYVPPYRHSQRYVHDINIVNVHNETKIVNVVNNVTVVNYNNYANRRAATVVDRQTMAGSRSVAAAFHSQPNSRDDKAWAQARPMAQVAVKPQAGNNRPSTAPKFNQHQTSNAQFAAQEHGKANTFNNKPAAQVQTNQSKAKPASGQFVAQPPQNNQGKPQEKSKTFNGNGQFASQSQQNQAKQNGQRPKNAAPGPVIVPQANTAKTANGKPQQQWQGQQKPQQKNAQKPKSNNAAPGPVILPLNPAGAPQPQGQNGQTQNGKAASSGGAAAAPSWKQTRPAQPSVSPAATPNQLPVSQTTQKPTWNNQKSNQQKATTRTTTAPKPQLLPMPVQPKVQPAKPSSQPTAKQVNVPKTQPSFQNGAGKNQSKQVQTHGQPQIPQGQGKAQVQGKAQSQAKPQPAGKAQNPACNTKNNACTK